MDVLPTMLAASGIPQPQGVGGTPAFDGVDLASLADGTCARDGVFSQWSAGPTGQYMQVTKRWKYFYSAADDKEFLFDRVADPGETRNQAGLSLVSKEKAKMRNALLASLKADGVTEALVEENGVLAWKRHPKIADALQSGATGELFRQTGLSDDPDAFLLIQDQPLAEQPVAEGIDRYR